MLTLWLNRVLQHRFRRLCFREWPIAYRPYRANQSAFHCITAWKNSKYAPYFLYRHTSSRTDGGCILELIRRNFSQITRYQRRFAVDVDVIEWDSVGQGYPNHYQTLCRFYHCLSDHMKTEWHWNLQSFFRSLAVNRKTVVFVLICRRKPYRHSIVSYLVNPSLQLSELLFAYVLSYRHTLQVIILCR